MINKQSNIYTIIYITVMVVVVGVALAFTAMALKDRQTENANADKMGQILQSVHLPSDRATVVADYAKYILSDPIYNAQGQLLDSVGGFAVNVALEAKKPVAQRQLPVYVCQLADGQGLKYILPMAGMGLWGPIWGYLAFDADGTTIYGAFFDHQGETPGLGAEITKPAFSDQFDGKVMFHDGRYLPIEVVKKGQKPSQAGADYVDGISGGTITSKGVSAMISDCLTPYQAFLQSLKN